MLRYVAGIIDNAPILAKMVIRRAADSLTLLPIAAPRSKSRSGPPRIVAFVG